MTLIDYLNSLSPEKQAAFVKRVEAVGHPTVDVYSASLPSWYDPEGRPNDVDSICTVHKHEGPGGSSHYHLLLLDYQYAYWSDPERRPVQGWLVSAGKANRNWFKPTVKSGGSTEDGPRHVYGASVYDPEARVLIFPGTQKKQPIDIGSRPIEVGKETKT